jgi:nucleoside-diphosphate-sugar epimerase
MILVTGATGFLGSEVARQLVEAGNSIRCSKRASSVIPDILKPHQASIEWVDADLLDIFALEKALDGVTQVYNSAAWVSLKHADKQPMIATNVTGTANLVNLCNDRSIRLLHVSSVAAVGLAKPGELITEKHHLDPVAEKDGYAISKLESEMEVWRGIAEGLNAVIVNPTIIIGKHAGTEGSGALFELIRKGLKFYTQGSTGFVDVSDVARVMIALMNSDVQDERFIINAENISYRDITTWIAEGFNIKPPATLAKPWMMELAWRVAAFVAAITGKDPFIDKVSARTASVNRDYDTSKLKKALSMNFKPIKESVNEICRVMLSAKE